MVTPPFLTATPPLSNRDATIILPTSAAVRERRAPKTAACAQNITDNGSRLGKTHGIRTSQIERFQIEALSEALCPPPNQRRKAITADRAAEGKRRVGAVHGRAPAREQIPPSPMEFLVGA
eukprot:138080-Rhodomonas_salina.1